LVVALAVFRLTTPSRQWRYHGAEHKAVRAHENHISLEATDRVLACSRIHPRCGTNLVVWMAIAAVWLGRLALVFQLPAILVTLACVAEALSWAGRHPRALAAKLLLTPGQLLQRFLTTSEPTWAEQNVACRALTACLAVHARIVESAVPARS